MKIISLDARDYAISNEQIAQFLNEYVYSDMIWDECMEPIEADDDNAFELLVEAVSDSCGTLYRPLLDFLSE